MRICIPVQENKGLESVPYNHFGSAPIFLICDSESNEIKAVNNGDLHHEHGMCQPLKALSGETVDVILVGGIGAGALSKLNSWGIKAYRAINAPVSQNIEMLMDNKLAELTLDNSCKHHDCH